MRLDKFLKVSRLVRRRTVASLLCGAGKVKANGRTAKASYQVVTGDVLELALGSRRLVVRVREVREQASVALAQELYEIVSEGPE